MNESKERSPWAGEDRRDGIPKERRGERKEEKGGKRWGRGGAQLPPSQIQFNLILFFYCIFPWSYIHMF
jgi:hypothetical protein